MAGADPPRSPPGDRGTAAFVARQDVRRTPTVPRPPKLQKSRSIVLEAVGRPAATHPSKLPVETVALPLRTPRYGSFAQVEPLRDPA